MVGENYSELVLGKINIKNGKINRARLLNDINEKYKIKLEVFVDI